MTNLSRMLVVLLAAVGAQAADTSPLKKDIDALNAQMMAAFKRDPATVSAYVTPRIVAK